MDAGHKIAERLFGLKLDLFGESGNKDIVILAVPRGGIIIGDIVASELAARLDVVVSRKIGAPNNPELAIGAVMPDGSYFLNKEIVDILNVSQEYIDIQANTQIKEIDRRLLSYRGSKEYDNEFEDKIMVLVDDGIATGATIVASANWLKNKQRCRKLLTAVPVAPADGNWNMVAENGEPKSYITQMIWTSADGTSSHTHELQNFELTDNGTDIVMSPTDTVALAGKIDVGTNGVINWEDVPVSIYFGNGQTIAVSLDDAATNSLSVVKQSLVL